MAVIQHGTLDLPGTFGLLIHGNYELPKLRQHFWGLAGTVQILSRPSMRTISVEGWAFDQWADVAKAEEFLEQLDDHQGVRATLRSQQTQGGTVLQEFSNCVFDGYEILGVGGQAPAIRQDIAGTVDTAGQQYYFVPIRLMWTQLG